MRYQGRITTWKDDKGFGFITPNGGGETVFVHINAFSSRAKRPVGNEFVTYELGRDPRGRIRAGAVAYLGERHRVSRTYPRGTGPLFLAGLFVVAVATAVLAGKLHKGVLAAYLLASVLTFWAYARDKSAARRNAGRIPEAVLHTLEFLCGWPGALAAQRILRHKLRKSSFQVLFWGAVAANCAVFAWVCSPGGSAIVEALTRTH